MFKMKIQHLDEEQGNGLLGCAFSDVISVWCCVRFLTLPSPTLKYHTKTGHTRAYLHLETINGLKSLIHPEETKTVHRIPKFCVLLNFTRKFYVIDNNLASQHQTFLC